MKEPFATDCPTPRTDALEAQLVERNEKAKDWSMMATVKDVALQGGLMLDHARQLERELAEITCEVIRYREDEADRDYQADQRSAVSEKQGCKAELVETPGLGEMMWCEPCGFYFGKNQPCPSTRSATRQSILREVAMNYVAADRPVFEKWLHKEIGDE